MKKNVNSIFNKLNSNPVQKSPVYVKGRSLIQTIAEKAVYEFTVSRPTYSQNCSKFATCTSEEVQPNSKILCE